MILFLYFFHFLLHLCGFEFRWKLTTLDDLLLVVVVAVFEGAMIRNVGVKPAPTAVIMTAASEAGVTSVAASDAVSAAAMKPYVVAAVVDPSEVRWLILVICTDNPCVVIMTLYSKYSQLVSA